MEKSRKDTDSSGQRAVQGAREFRAVPGQASLSPWICAGAIGGRQRSLLVGLSERVRLGGIGSLDHLLGASPSWQLCLAKAQGLAGLPPHHLPALPAPGAFIPQGLSKAEVL